MRPSPLQRGTSSHQGCYGRTCALSSWHRSRYYGACARLTEQMERLAREAGDATMVVSATPSANTVHFYLGQGFEPMAEPLPELYELEPEDVHMQKRL